MTILPLLPQLERYLEQHQLELRFEKQKRLFEANPFHPGLRTELLEPHQMRIWSFRLDTKYRVVFIFRSKGEVEVIDINDHYQ